MQAFHFVKADYAMSNLQNRHLKVSLWKDLNDPFELFAANLKDNEARKVFRDLQSDLHLTGGVLCFSSENDNPVMWSQYGDKHYGACLEFDVRAESFRPI